MDEKEFQQQMQEKQEKIEKILERYLPKNPSFQKTIFDSMEYSLMGGGKRLRPMMVQESYELFGGKNQALVEPFMAAIEMIHTYSLVHDDLPAMDNDDYRRGRKTTHIVYGEDMGILTGDALLNYAFETVSSAFGQTESLEQTARAFQILGKKAGVYGMVGGQVVDVERTGQALTADVLEFIYRLKTSALLEASLMIGAALAGAKDQDIQIMEEIGGFVGMAFQIQDDILDETSTTQELGKPVHSDERNEKTTYVSLYGMASSRQAVEEYSEKALALLGEMKQQNLFLSTLIEKLINRKK
ncbi:MAG: polyprenyl synthetase family protein [Lachnospiraceae bacterium]|nr:polyprenyl synthetase family protein [Lachnospiraceae bacterium]